MSDSLWPHVTPWPHDPMWPLVQHTRLPCPSLSPAVWSNLCSLSQWCHLTISSSATLFSFCLQSFPASGSLSMAESLKWKLISSILQCYTFSSLAWSLAHTLANLVFKLWLQNYSVHVWWCVCMCSVLSDSFVAPWTVPFQLLCP